MKVIIDISENDYWLACNHPDALISVYAHAIKNGTPLPKGHGRLIDADELLDNVEDYGEGQKKMMWIAPCYVKKAPTIIEADTGETERTRRMSC